MGRFLSHFFLFATILLPAWALAADSFAEVIQPAFVSHCVPCHGKEGKVKGKVDLLKLSSAADLQAKPDLLATLIDVVDLQEMPPEDEPQLGTDQRVALRDALEALFDGSDKPIPQAPIRRMNRFQYNNAVVDLFELNRSVFALPERMMREHKPYFQPAQAKMPETIAVGSRPLGKSQLIEPRLSGVAPFPQDLRAEHGFDNRGDHLSLSPMLLESFLKLSQSVVDSHDFNARNVKRWPALFTPPGEKKTAAPAVRPKKKAGKPPNAKNPAGAATTTGDAPTVPDDTDYATLVPERLAPFLRRAFRRPVPDELLDRYTHHVLARLEEGASFTEAMKEAASAAIASPRFLYLYDRASERSGAVQLDAYDLASRLSFFLWASLPDDELLDRAADGTLLSPDVVEAQVDRMLKDRRSRRFCESFPAQWLQLERIISSTPDPKHHPEFYFSKYRMSMHMMLEPLLLFERVYVENRSILEFIDSDYSYRSGPLTTFYNPQHKKQIGGNPTRLTFKQTKLADRRHGGLITTAAILTMTSGPEHSNPITRGAWLATVFFNDPPEPPPADVPPLAETPPAGEENLTLRERLAAHRERADCAGCHEKIDPLGFALENFGPTGKWRDAYENGREVDMQGRLFRSHSFTNVVEFKDAMLAEKERFVRAFAEHLLSFALARGISPADDASLDHITTAIIADDFRLHTAIQEVVKSDAFHLKSTPKTTPSSP